DNLFVGAKLGFEDELVLPCRRPVGRHIPVDAIRLALHRSSFELTRTAGDKGGLIHVAAVVEDGGVDRVNRRDRYSLTSDGPFGSLGTLVGKIKLHHPKLPGRVASKVGQTLAPGSGDFMDQLVGADLGTLGGLLEPDGVSCSLEPAKGEVAKHLL